MPVTIKDIATSAGVSVGVVSTVLNNANTNIGVSEKTRKRIIEVSKKLNYRPNLMARGLRQKRTGLIGVVTPRVDWGHWPQILQGIEDVLEQIDYNIILCTTEENLESEKRSLTLLRDKGVDGIIAVPSWQTFASTTPANERSHRREFVGNLGIYARLIEDLPIVCVTRELTGLNCPSVYVDGWKMGKLAAEHLISLGHRRLAFIGEARKDVLEGFIETARTLGVVIEKDYILDFGEEIEDGQRDMEKLLTLHQRPTAVFAIRDILAIGAIKAARAHGLNVPDDISVLGADDTIVATLSDIAISSVGQPKVEQGKVAASILMRMIDGESAQTTILDPYLAKRESTGYLKEGR